MSKRLLFTGLLASISCWVAVGCTTLSPGAGRWVGAWGCSAVEPFPKIPAIGIPEPPVVKGTIVYRLPLSISGTRLIVRISNEAGQSPLVIGGASVAIVASGFSAVPGTSRLLSFGGKRHLTIAPGTAATTDAVDLSVPAATDLLVAIHLPEPTVQAQAGNGVVARVIGDKEVPADRIPAEAQPLLSRPLVSGVFVFAGANAETIVTFGDSITDGAASLSPEVRGWPGALANRIAELNEAGKVAISNQGIGGNRLLSNGMGLSALARFDRDVLSVPNVSKVIILEGINDIGMGSGTFAAPGSAVSAEVLIGAYRQLISRAHLHGISVLGGTLLPFRGAFYFSDDRESVRQAVNRWIRTSGEFDGVVDFEAALRDKADPSRLERSYDSGDALHPNDSGYVAMANAVDTRILVTRN